MDKINEMISDLGLEKNITLADIPDIDLYMDQVIQLFENKFGDLKRHEEDKVLTKTMINNYAKGKLFFPIANKKYSKEHIILVSLIYQLKGALSISDIKETLDIVNRRTSDGDFQLDNFYSSYLQLVKANAENFEKDFHAHVKEVRSEVTSLKEEDQGELEQVLLIASLVNMSNFYRRAAERLVDAIRNGSEKS